MGTQKNRLNEMVLLSTKTHVKLMPKEIYAIYVHKLSLSGPMSIYYFEHTCCMENSVDPGQLVSEEAR